MKGLRTGLIVLLVACVVFSYTVPVIRVEGCPEDIGAVACYHYYQSITRHYFGFGAQNDYIFGYHFW